MQLVSKKMNNISTYGRPTVVFDASNPQHREWVLEFEKTMSWKNCPMRFELVDNFENVVAMIRSKLMNYYLEQEFGGQTL